MFFNSLASCDVPDAVYKSNQCYSQPQDSIKNELAYDNIPDIGYSFSQPTQIDDLLISTQLLLSQPANANTVRVNLQVFTFDGLKYNYNFVVAELCSKIGTTYDQIFR